VLLIDDEKTHCEQYRDCAEALLYPVVLSIAHGLKQAVSLAEKGIYDIIILDLELNGSDGDGILFLTKLKEMKLRKKPYIIVITKNPSYTTHNIARSMGADYLFMKSKPDYSPRLVFEFAFSCMKEPVLREENKPSLETIITREIEKIGFTSSMGGKRYLVDAVITAIHLNKNNVSLKSDIYPIVAKRHKKTISNVQRSIGNAIIKTWYMTDIETLLENYSSNIDYNTGIPTNKEMILHLANKIKKEYAGCIA
jgi:CheY-like chemotaxis protein